MKNILDNKNIKIIDAICNNARLSYNQISKITHISKDSVRKRIEKLEKEKYLLFYFALIDYHKIGLKLFHVYITAKKAKDLHENILDKLNEDKKIVSIVWLLGKYDIEIQITAKNKKEALKEIKKLIPNKDISEIEIIEAEKFKLYSMDYGTSIRKDKIINYSEDKKIEFDEIDLKLIEKLAKNGRERIIDIADELHIGEDIIRYKINKLVKDKVILGFYARANKHKKNLLTYLLLIKTKENISKDKILHMQHMKDIYYLKKCKGKYKYILRFFSDNNQEIIKNLNEIRESLGENLINYEIHQFLERKKLLPYEK